LQNADYQDAYDETSTAFQGGRPLADFAQSFSNVRFCTYSELVSFNGNVTSDMNFFYTNGSLIPYTGFLVPDSNNAKWKIDQLVNFPDQILTRFCAGLNNLNYQSSYDQLTPQKKAQRTLQAFIANYGNVMRCMFTFPVQIADQATATLIYTLTDRQTSKQNVMLVAYARDTWGIQDLTNV
jgi:phage-related protein